MDSGQPYILLFDGVCNLCSGVVQCVLKRDRRDQFRFAPLQSDAGRTLLDRFKLPEEKLYSLVLIRGNTCYTRSGAALRVLRALGGGWQLFYVFILVPPFIRNAVYNLIARNRYRWFGQKKECWMPANEWVSKFL